MTRSSARVWAYMPFSPALPNGVRTPSTNTTSRRVRGTGGLLAWWAADGCTGMPVGCRPMLLAGNPRGHRRPRVRAVTPARRLRTRRAAHPPRNAARRRLRGYEVARGWRGGGAARVSQRRGSRTRRRGGPRRPRPPSGPRCRPATGGRRARQRRGEPPRPSGRPAGSRSPGAAGRATGRSRRGRRAPSANAVSAARAWRQPGGGHGVAVGPGPRRRRTVGAQGQRRQVRLGQGLRPADGLEPLPLVALRSTGGRRGRSADGWWAPPWRSRRAPASGSTRPGETSRSLGDAVAGLPQLADHGGAAALAHAVHARGAPPRVDPLPAGPVNCSRASNSSRAHSALPWRGQVDAHQRRAARRAPRRRGRRSAATARAAAGSTSRRRSAPWPGDSPR